MPLLRYFATIGVLLTALLVLCDFMFEQSKAEMRERAAAQRETNLPRPKIYSRVGEHAAALAQATPAPAVWHQTAPAYQAEERLLASSAESLLQPAPPRPVSGDTAAQDTVRKAKPQRKSAKVRTRRHSSDVAALRADGMPGALGYAQVRPAWPFRTQAPPGPFFGQDRSARSFAGQGRAMQPFFAQRMPNPN